MLGTMRGELIEASGVAGLGGNGVLMSRTASEILLVSLGMSCQTSFQLRRFSTSYPGRSVIQKGVFDWVICSPASLIEWLQSDIRCFEPGEIILRRGVPWWPRFQVYFWHGFQSPPRKVPFFARMLGSVGLQARVPERKPYDIDSQFACERQKFQYQRSQLFRSRGTRVQFIWSNTQNNLTSDVFAPGEDDSWMLTSELVDKIQEQLRRLFGVKSSLHVITRGDRCSLDLTCRDLVTLVQPGSTEWTGDDLEWDSALNMIIRSAEA
jgi:hypothetical protein